MNRDDLFRHLVRLIDPVIADPRWKREGDEFGVSILGMLMYGFALVTGRSVMLLDVDDIDAAVVRALTERTGAAYKWTSGLVADANRSAFDPQYHPGQYELIGAGHSYFGEDDPFAVVDNVFENIRAFRRRIGDT